MNKLHIYYLESLVDPHRGDSLITNEEREAVRVLYDDWRRLRRTVDFLEAATKTKEDDDAPNT